MIQKQLSQIEQVQVDANDAYWAVNDPGSVPVSKMNGLKNLFYDRSLVSSTLIKFANEASELDAPELALRREWAKRYVDDIDKDAVEEIRGIEYANNLDATETTVSRKFKSSELGDYISLHSMRPSDPEAMSHRLQYLDVDLGLLPDQVLSPRLSQGNHITIIRTGSKLIFDKKSQRLLPEENDGQADGWIIMNDNELADFLAFEGAVADCPMVSVDFLNPITGSKVASSGSHAGWKNLRNGIDLSLGQAVKDSGLDTTIPRITVGPGARHLALPNRVLDNGDRSGDNLNGLPLVSYLEDSDVTEIDGQPAHIVDTVDLAGRLFADALGIKDYDKAVAEGQIVLSNIDTVETEDLHSYRRDGHWNPLSPTAKIRPEAGRHLQVTKPYYSSALANVREELFGESTYEKSGKLRIVSDDKDKVSYVVS
jgi:hypothetical protein